MRAFKASVSLASLHRTAFWVLMAIGVEKPIVKPEFPMTFDLSSDPHEDWNLFATRLDNAWVFGPVFRNIMQYEMSVKKYPNIKPGEEFKGYGPSRAA